jgi:hypothetical protein
MTERRPVVFAEEEFDPGISVEGALRQNLGRPCSANPYAPSWALAWESWAFGWGTADYFLETRAQEKVRRYMAYRRVTETVEERARTFVAFCDRAERSGLVGYARRGRACAQDVLDLAAQLAKDERVSANSSVGLRHRDERRI